MYQKKYYNKRGGNEAPTRVHNNNANNVNNINNNNNTNNSSQVDIKTEIKPILTFNNEKDYTEFFTKNKRTCEYLGDYYIHSNKADIINKLKSLPDRVNPSLSNSQNNSKIVYAEESDPEYEGIMNKINAHKEWYNVNENYQEKLLNTFEYMFEHISRGIFISIRNQAIHELIIFANPNYVNNWSQNLKFENNQTQEEYYRSKSKYYKRKEHILPMKNWYAGGFLIDNEYPFKYENGKRINMLWTNHSLIPILDMLTTLVNCRKVKDCDFFINKRDHAVLRKSLEEPYRNLHPEPLPMIPDKYRLPTNGTGGNNFVPIMSFYGSDTFADVLFPCAEDWTIACGTIFMQGDEKPAAGFADVNYMKYEHINWEDKIPTAVFRGRGTGGSNLENNQRFQLATFADELNDKSILDVGIISYNIRDKVNYTPRLTITYPKPDTLPFKMGEFMSMNQQMLYKYHLSVQGHAAINRTSYMYKSKSLVMVLEPQFTEVSEQWFSTIFKENVDYVQVKKDFSDIVPKIEWCREHDEECREMTMSALNKQRKYLSKSGILNYLQILINEIY